jgi:hypothetical protein
MGAEGALLILLLLIPAAGIFGWWMGRNSGKTFSISMAGSCDDLGVMVEQQIQHPVQKAEVSLRSWYRDNTTELNFPVSGTGKTISQAVTSYIKHHADINIRGTDRSWKLTIEGKWNREPNQLCDQAQRLLAEHPPAEQVHILENAIELHKLK